MLILCRKYLSRPAVSDIFVLTYDRMRRYEGAWHMEKKLLFPSYVFLESEKGTLLSDEMSKFLPYAFINEAGHSQRICDTGENSGLIRMNEKAERFLKFLYGNQYHLEMSKGIIQNGMPRITAGPLKGMEQRILRIDRHKRLARLEMPVNRNLGRMQGSRTIKEYNLGYITAGLEITGKETK